MILEELLPTLRKLRKAGQGWMACCPAHEDRSPSLSLRKGHTGWLVRCWAGCTLDEICRALGIRVSELFFDSGHAMSSEEIQQRQRDRKRRERQKYLEAQASGATIDCIREAERFLQVARGIDSSTWDPDRLDRELNHVCDALDIVLQEERQELYEHL